MIFHYLEMCKPLRIKCQRHIARMQTSSESTPVFFPLDVLHLNWCFWKKVQKNLINVTYKQISVDKYILENTIYRQNFPAGLLRTFYLLRCNICFHKRSIICCAPPKDLAINIFYVNCILVYAILWKAL